MKTWPIEGGFPPFRRSLSRTDAALRASKARTRNKRLLGVELLHMRPTCTCVSQARRGTFTLGSCRTAQWSRMSRRGGVWVRTHAEYYPVLAKRSCRVPKGLCLGRHTGAWQCHRQHEPGQAWRRPMASLASWSRCSLVLRSLQQLQLHGTMARTTTTPALRRVNVHTATRALRPAHASREVGRRPPTNGSRARTAPHGGRPPPHPRPDDRPDAEARPAGRSRSRRRRARCCRRAPSTAWMPAPSPPSTTRRRGRRRTCRAG